MAPAEDAFRAPLAGRLLWKLKGQEDTLKDVHLTVDLRREWASHRPFGQADRHSLFQPDRVAIETSDGHVVEERFNPRESFKGHVLETPWDHLQLAYFAGYAMWTYLNTPFLFALPGVETEEIEPWQENGEVWRRLKAKFPPNIATHSAEQTSTSTNRVCSNATTTTSISHQEPRARTMCRSSRSSPESRCRPTKGVWT